MKAGIAVDDWKLPVFRRRLGVAGYAFEEKNGLNKGVSIITVETDNLIALKKVIEDCQAECRKSKTH